MNNVECLSKGMVCMLVLFWLAACGSESTQTTPAEDTAGTEIAPPSEDTEPVSFCGNGVVESGEACDDGGPSPTCSEDCTPLTCVPESTEQVTTVPTYDAAYFNWADAQEKTFTFPDASLSTEKITMYMTMACAPGGCDPWDRLGHLKVKRPTGAVAEDGTPVMEAVEIARFITPYAIDKSMGGPGDCTWTYDVSAYQSLLRGEVTLSLFISTWIGDARGWSVTVWFDFHHGRPAMEAYQVQNLWNKGHLVYGHPDKPVEEHLAARTVAVDAAAEKAVVRIITTGHGQGNTDNAAEFAIKEHTVKAGDQTHKWTLWRSDCHTNTCGPQGGNWTPGRAGWCPGDSVVPEDVDVTAAAVAGQEVVLDYDIEPYENCCRPDNKSCNASSTNCCMTFAGESNFNYTGHTEPNFAVSSHLILYRDPCGTAAK